MIDSDSRSSSEPAPLPAMVSDTVQPHDSQASGRAASRPFVALALGAGILAGGLSWLIGEAVYGRFPPPSEIQNVMGQSIKKVKFEDQAAADFKDAVLAFTVLGAVMGGALGAAGAWTRQASNAVWKPAVAGLVLGALLGAGGSAAFLPLYFGALDRAKEELSRDLLLPLLVHGGIWGMCGLAGGLAYGIGLGGGRNRLIHAAIGGVLGAVLGASLYELMGAIVFPADKTTSPLAITGSARLAARLLVAIPSALLAAVVVNMQANPPSRTPYTT